jgi:hypothetical protein
MMRVNNGPVTDPALIVTLCAAAVGRTLAGRAVVTVDARASGVIAAVPPGTWTTGVAGLALVALALVDAQGPGLLAAVALAVGAFAIGFLRGAVRIVVAEERRERPKVRITARRRTASRRRPAA